MPPDAQSAASSQPKRRGFQFSLRTLLIGVTLIAVALSGGRLARSTMQQRATVRMIQRQGGTVAYAPVPADETWWTARLRTWLPQYYFDDVIIVRLQGTAVTDDRLRQVGQLSQLRVLMLENTNISDQGIRHLKALSELEWLDIRNTRATYRGPTELQPVLPNCCIIEFGNPTPPRELSTTP